MKTYSGGQRRRLDVALGIVHEPAVLFLDEPTTGLDPQNRANLWDHLRVLRERGTTIFLTTHYLEEADALCDRVMIIDHGLIVADGAPRELKREVVGDSVVLNVADGAAERARALLAQAPFVSDVGAADEDGQLRCYVEDGAAALPEILRMLDAAGVGLRAISLSEPTLDDVFLAKTGRSLRDTGPGGAMKLVRDTSLYARRHGLQMLRNPVWLFVGFSTPLLYLALFTPLLKSLPGFAGANVLDIFLPGILALLAFASGSSAGFGTIFELQAGVIERFRVTPTSRLAILLGPLVSGMTSMFIFDAVLVGVGAAFGYHVHWAGLLVLAVLLAVFSLSLAAFSTATALVTKEISAFAAVINGINLPILLLAGVLLPISFGPEWLRVLAHFNPLYYLVVASRALSHGTFSGGAVWQAFAVLVPLCAITMTWATRVYRRAVS